jgi:hypothetical protein
MFSLLVDTIVCCDGEQPGDERTLFIIFLQILICAPNVSWAASSAAVPSPSMR